MRTICTFSFDAAETFPSYVHSRGRAKGLNPTYFHFAVEEEQDRILRDLASFNTYETVRSLILNENILQ